jgi:hypothetical protein
MWFFQNFFYSCDLVIKRNFFKYIDIYTRVRNNDPMLLSCSIVRTIIPLSRKLFNEWNERLIDWEKNEFYQSLKSQYSGEEFQTRLILYATYPRFDKLVTTTLGHLIKLPFSLHNNSEFISFPIPRSKYNLFPHLWVPTLTNFEVESFEESLNYLKEIIKIVIYFNLFLYAR